MSSDTKKWLILAVVLVALETLIQVVDTSLIANEAVGLRITSGMDVSKVVLAIQELSLTSVFLTIVIGSYFAWDTWRGSSWMRYLAVAFLAIAMYEFYSAISSEAGSPYIELSACSVCVAIFYSLVVYFSPARWAFEPGERVMQGRDNAP
jgi:hypothetical protein